MIKLTRPVHGRDVIGERKRSAFICLFPSVDIRLARADKGIPSIRGESIKASLELITGVPAGT